MRNFSIYLLITSLFISTFFISCEKNKESVQLITIKGFYLGMSHNELIDLINSKYSLHFSRSGFHTYYTNRKEQYYSNIEEYTKNKLIPILTTEVTIFFFVETCHGKSLR